MRVAPHCSAHLRTHRDGGGRVGRSGGSRKSIATGMRTRFARRPSAGRRPAGGGGRSTEVLTFGRFGLFPATPSLHADAFTAGARFDEALHNLSEPLHPARCGTFRIGGVMV